ncbi:MAG: hypothetical protein GY906_27650 [bacterium]|nr:hypothetical protein [bacterium]
MNRRIRPLVLVLVLGVMMATQVTKADEAQQQTDPALEALKREKEIAELKKQIAEAEKATRATGLPDTDTTGKEGTVSIDDKAGYYGEVLAYRSLTDAASQIAQKIGVPGPTAGVVVITTETSLRTKAMLWGVVSSKLTAFDGEFERYLKKLRPVDSQKGVDRLLEGESVTAALLALPSVLGGAADIAAFFRSDVEVKGRTIELAEAALIADVAQHLRDLQWKVTFSQLGLASESKILSQLGTTLDKRLELVGRRDQVSDFVEAEKVAITKLREEAKMLEAEIEKEEKAPTPDQTRINDRKARLGDVNGEIGIKQRIVNEWKSLASAIEDLIAAFDAYEKALTTGTNEKPSPIKSLAVIDSLKNDQDARVLSLSIPCQGSDIQVMKSMWSSRVLYVGGSVSVFFLVDQSGVVEVSGTLPNWKSESFKLSKGPKEDS